jgi:hypothetical protein
VERRLVCERRLEDRLVTHAAALALAPALLGLAGCFDVHSVDPGALVIDDFDDGDFQPTDVAFPPWTCFKFNPQTSESGYRCDHGAGYQSQYSLFVEATVNDVPDGVQQYGGVFLGTFGSTPQDFSHFRELVFSVQLQSGNPSLPSGARLQVQFNCGTALAEDGSPDPSASVVQGAGFDEMWQTDALALVDFATPSFVSTHIAGGPTACLQRVDSISFSVEAQLPDGASAHFTLYVDNVYLL